LDGQATVLVGGDLQVRRPIVHCQLPVRPPRLTLPVGVGLGNLFHAMTMIA
jgi:hypothetical protein